MCSLANAAMPSQTGGEDDDLCSMMKDLLNIGLTTREDLLAFGFTEAEVDAAKGVATASNARTPCAFGAETGPTTPPQSTRPGMLNWTPQTVPTRSAFQPRLFPTTTSATSPTVPVAARANHRTRSREESPPGALADAPLPPCSDDCVASNEEGPTHEGSSGDNTARGFPASREPMTEAKRLERQRDAEQAKRFSDCLVGGAGVSRTLFDGTDTNTAVLPPTVKPNSALRFTVDDAIMAKEMSRLLLHPDTSGDDQRSFDDFCAERALLCEQDM